MDSVIMEQVLKEILQQQKEMTTEIEKESEARQQIFLKMEAFEKKLDTLKVPMNNDTSVLLPAIKNGIEEVKTVVQAQPKAIVHQRSFQLFPNKPEEYYKIIFGGIFKGLVILIVGIYALTIINRYIREQEYLHYKQAWQFLYSRQKEDDKQFLERVWKDSEKADASWEAKFPAAQPKAGVLKTPTKKAK